MDNESGNYLESEYRYVLNMNNIQIVNLDIIRNVNPNTQIRIVNSDKIRIGIPSIICENEYHSKIKSLYLRIMNPDTNRKWIMNPDIESEHYLDSES